MRAARHTYHLETLPVPYEEPHPDAIARQQMLFGAVGSFEHEDPDRRGGCEEHAARTAGCDCDQTPSHLNPRR